MERISALSSHLSNEQPLAIQQTGIFQFSIFPLI